MTIITHFSSHRLNDSFQVTYCSVGAIDKKNGVQRTINETKL